VEKNLECEEEEKNESQQGARDDLGDFDMAGYPLVPVRVTNRYQRSSPGPTTRLNFGRRPFVPVPNTNRYESPSQTGTKAPRPPEPSNRYKWPHWYRFVREPVPMA
jgi:hypothetical protein